MEYGYFDPKAREYVITRPDTPIAWFNYIRNNRWTGMVSNTGGGVAVFDDPRFKRVLRYRFNNIPHDRPGRYIYIRDQETGEYWSATWAPVLKDLKKFHYRCRVGLNYQVIESQYKSIKTSITYFVAPDDNAEIWLFSIRNVGHKKRTLRTYSYAELNVWGAMRDLMNMDNGPRCTRLSFENNCIIHSTWNDLGSSLGTMNWVRMHGFITATLPPQGWYTHREFFLGPYRSEANPIVVENGECPQYAKNGGYPLGTLIHDHNLAPGEEVELAYVIAADDSREAAEPVALKFQNLAACKAALETVKERWDEHLAKLQCATPDPDFDIAVNVFNQYQSTMTTHLSRSISPYEWGVGRGIGFRDSSQDVMGSCHALADTVKNTLRILIKGQNPDGVATHNIFPKTGEGQDRDFYDDHLWLPMSVAHYLKETGDMAFLDEKIPYRQGEGAPVYDHLKLCIDVTWQRRGQHGLPHIGHADWNDGLNPGSMESESVFDAVLFCYTAREMENLARFIGKNSDADMFRSRYEEMKRITNDVAWDGGWYKRIFYKEGGYIGGKDQPSKLGYIFLEPQPWAVMSGVAEGERGVKALDSVREHLCTAYGIALLREAFTEYDPTIGSISIVLPGIKENGSVFCHTNPWVIIAETVLGRGEQAMDYYKRIAYGTKSKIADIHGTEPYVYSQHIGLPPWYHPGRAGNPWLTGSATWSMLALSQWILGVRPVWGGLMIDPCVPKSWKKFRIDREYRGARFNIQVENSDGVEKGVKEVKIDGKALPNNIIPPQEKGSTHKVKVTMG